MITKDDIATYRATYPREYWEQKAKEQNSYCVAPVGAILAVNALCYAYEEIERQRDELLAALEYVISDLELRASLKEDDERGEVDIGNGCYEQALAAIARNNRLPEGSPVD